MSRSKKENPFECKCPRINNALWSGPGFSRRQFFQIAGTGLAGYYFTNVLRPLEVVAASSVVTRNTAKNCIFILLSGGASHTDTFDLKEGAWTPAAFAPTTYANFRFPQGLMPKLATELDRIAIIRSARAWALVHNFAQLWTQIARNPTAVLGKISPNIGAVVALEASSRRKPSDILPGFIALNAGQLQGPGYFPSSFAPFSLVPSTAGLPNTTHFDNNQTRFNTRWQLLQSLDGNLRQDSPVGRPPEDMDDFYNSAKSLMYNPTVDAIFKFTTDERNRFGASGFGDACLVSRNILKADLGTRFIHINLGGWDNHSNIYAAGSLPARASQLDNGLGQLIAELSTTASTTPGKTLLDDTLLVMMGEFGRTVGNPNNQAGRDHYLQQFVVMAGGGVQGGRAIGATNATGASTVDPGWSRGRDIKPEDVASTIYSALGIDWTTTRYDDPFKRGFEYVPFAGDGAYAPVDEIFG